MKSTISEIKNVHDGITNRLDMAKKISCVLKVIATEIVENETKKEKWEKKTYNFPVQKYQAIKHTYNWSPRQKKKKGMDKNKI